jgi:hypothetical protein
MGIKIVSVFENETSDHLVSEVLSIPLIIREDSDTALTSGGTTSEAIGIPTLVKSDKPLSQLSNAKPFSNLMDGTICERIGIPLLIK